MSERFMAAVPISDYHSRFRPPCASRLHDCPALAVYSTRSLALASSTVCHCMLAGVSGPPRFKAITWSMM